MQLSRDDEHLPVGPGVRDRPGSTTQRYQGVGLRYNETGLRDDPIGPKADGEFRVIVLGDAITLGWGVEPAATFPAVLLPAR